MAQMTPARIRLLSFFREPFPTQRVDIDVLFGSELAARGHEVDFVMQAANPGVEVGTRPWHGRTVWVGPTVATTGFLRRLQKHVLAIWHDIRAFRHIDPRRYRAVQVMDKFPIGYLALLIARRRGLKFYFWLSFPFAEAERELARAGTARYPWLAHLRGRLSGWLLYRRILPLCDHVFVQSEQMKLDICARGIDPRRVTPVPMGVRLDRFVPKSVLPHAAVTSRTPDAQPVITADARPILPRSVPATAAPAARAESGVLLAYLGVLSAERHLEVLIDMLAALRSAGLAARLLLVGDADVSAHRVALEHRAAQLHVESFVDITGFLPHADALQRVREADIALSPIFPAPQFLLASPTKLVEYMALGLPVVANRHPEQRRVLRESRGGICVPWSARHFARAVRYLAACGDTRRAQIGQRGRRWVEANREYTQIAAGLERTYLELQGAGRTP